jgi:hypothetical protein
MQSIDDLPARRREFLKIPSIESKTWISPTQKKQ